MGFVKIIKIQSTTNSTRTERESGECTRKLWRFGKRKKRQAWSGMKQAASMRYCEWEALIAAVPFSAEFSFPLRFHGKAGQSGERSEILMKR